MGQDLQTRPRRQTLPLRLEHRLPAHHPGAGKLDAIALPNEPEMKALERRCGECGSVTPPTIEPMPNRSKRQRCRSLSAISAWQESAAGLAQDVPQSAGIIRIRHRKDSPRSRSVRLVQPYAGDRRASLLASYRRTVRGGAECGAEVARKQPSRHAIPVHRITGG